MTLLREIRALMRSEVGGRVRARVREFRRLGRRGEDELFQEMCFCILTANFNAERAIAIQEAIAGGFITLPKGRLAARLRALGHRYPNARAAYIVEARKHRGGIRRVLLGLGGLELRKWFACNVKGLGFKEASHFLRNIGYGEYAILDFHIIDILERNGLIARPKTLTPRRYVEIEGALKRMGGRLGLDMADLDLCLWFMETGKILK